MGAPNPNRPLLVLTTPPDLDLTDSDATRRLQVREEAVELAAEAKALVWYLLQAQ
jgi:hypothetical protein